MTVRNVLAFVHDVSNAVEFIDEGGEEWCQWQQWRLLRTKLRVSLPPREGKTFLQWLRTRVGEETKRVVRKMDGLSLQ